MVDYKIIVEQEHQPHPQSGEELWKHRLLPQSGGGHQ